METLVKDDRILHTILYQLLLILLPVVLGDTLDIVGELFLLGVESLCTFGEGHGHQQAKIDHGDIHEGELLDRRDITTHLYLVQGSDFIKKEAEVELETIMSNEDIGETSPIIIMIAMQLLARILLGGLNLQLDGSHLCQVVHEVLHTIETNEHLLQVIDLLYFSLNIIKI